jgi:amino acid adenylation domain-containing protein
VTAQTIAAPTDTLPLTNSQTGLMVVHRAVGVDHLYNVVAELELAPRWSPDQVRAALAEVLTVQPALRQALHELPEPHAVLAPAPAPADVPLRTVHTDDAGFPRRLAELVTEIGTVAFVLAQAPLIRFVLLRSDSGDRQVLLLVVHHTVFDGFSLAVLAQDLDAALLGTLDVEALRRKRERALGRELAAQRAAVANPAVDQAAKARAERLRAAPPTVLYPRPHRPVTTDFQGERIAVPLSAKASEAVDRTCAELGVSPFVFFSAVYSMLLGRHAGTSPVVFGTPLVARRTIGGYDLCGLFVNTVPVIVDVDWDASFRDFTRGTVGTEIDSVKKDTGVPFDLIVRHAGPDRSTNRNPFFATMLAMQDIAATPRDSAVRGIREHGNGTAKLDFWLGVTPTPAGWLLEVEYDTTLVPGSIADGLLSSLLELLDRVTADPDVILRDACTDATVRETGHTDGHWHQPPAATLTEWLDTALTRFADRDAVHSATESLTYRELADRVDTATAGLAALGVGVGDVVGLATTTLTDTIVSMLALLRLRAAYLPLDLQLPADRVRHMVSKADCRLVVGTGDVPGARVVAPADLTADTAPTLTTGSPEDAVYVMFTSGSTGLPKGVHMHDAPLRNLTAWQIAALGMTADTRFLQYAPLGFDVSFQEIVPTLVSGGTVVSREPADRRDFRAVLARVRDSRATHVYLPVAALAPFTQMATDDHVELPDLRTLCVSGEQLVIDGAVRAFFRDRPHVELVNLYGPTETHAVTTHRLSDQDGEWPVHVPIGRPLTGVTAQVVDRTGHLAPRGVVGELLLGGVCPALGYLNDPDLTAGRFLADPHAPGGVRYRTGDQVLWDDDGDLVFLGREDHQVKVRGYRIELGEIEAAAAELPGVRRAVAAARGTGADRHLVLFLQPRPDAEPDPELVRTRLAEMLPGYMVPTWVLTVPVIHTTGNGKIDRPALLTDADTLIAARSRQDTDQVVLADDPVTAWLQQLWARTLGGPPPSVTASLTTLGAHSLTVLTVLASIEQEYGVRVPMLAFFRDPTVRTLAEQIERARQTEVIR